MDLHYLKIFDSVAFHESFTKASQELHISQSALSIQMKRFEEELGLKLFNRVGNHIRLNENGQILFAYSHQIFELLTQAEYKLFNKNDFVTGTLTIGASNTPGTYIFPKIIAYYKKLYPGVSVNLNIGNTSEIAHYVNNGTLDFALNGGNTTYHKDVYVERLIEDELVLIASPNLLKTGNVHIDNEILGQLDFVVHKTDSQLYSYYKNFIEAHNLPEKVSITLGNIDAIKQAVIAGIGVSLVPYVSAALELKTGVFVKLDFEGKKLMYPYSLVYNRNKYLSPPAEKFIELLRQYAIPSDSDKT
jgi:DNA-binding transcriptional LysR family regulator